LKLFPNINNMVVSVPAVAILKLSFFLIFATECTQSLPAYT
jgi:hypothetical protein